VLIHVWLLRSSRPERILRCRGAVVTGSASARRGSASPRSLLEPRRRRPRALP